jgi:hypothetical protein
VWRRAGAVVCCGFRRRPWREGGGPTLEIFTKDKTLHQHLPVANGVGYGHIAFEVVGVESAMETVIAL